MADTLYAIVVDLADEQLDIKHIQFYVKNEPMFAHWWNYLPGLFLVETALSAIEITRRVKEHIGDVSFIVMQVDANDTSGWLFEEAGDWITRRRAEHAAGERQAVERTE